MRWSFLVLLLLGFSELSTARGTDAAPAWSQPVKGLRARLFTEPSHEPEFDKTFDVWIELEEVGIDTSLGLNHQTLLIPFGRWQLALAVADSSERLLSQKPLDGDFLSETWNLVLPPNGRISFPIGRGGSSPHRNLLGPGRLLQLDPVSEWLIPLANGPFYLSGFFDAPYPLNHSPEAGGFKNTMTRSPPDHREKPYRGWAGTLVLPAIEIPQN
jgi:hypothetical protein